MYIEVSQGIIRAVMTYSYSESIRAERTLAFFLAPSEGKPHIDLL